MLHLFQSTTNSTRSKKAQAIKTDLAGRWDLSQSFTLPGEGPANLLVAGLNQMFGRLHEFVFDLTRRSVETATVAPLTHAIAGKVRQSSATLSHGAEQIEQTCRRLAEGIGTSASNANQALEQSASIVEEINRTSTLTDQALQCMHSMEQDVHRLTTAIAELDDRSRSIGTIIESISNIADHTGLLSLNAFIEAARAGAHGAGFGVIANEIRQLSQESARAAKEIKDSLSGISNLIQETVDAVTRVEKGVASGVQGNHQAATALQQVSFKHGHFHTHLESVISSVGDQKKAVASFADDVAQIAAIGKEGQNDSSKLAELADKVKTLTEQQLLATGIFILPQYRKAEAAIIAIANTPEIQSPGNSIDQSLQQHLRSLPYLELMYMTDANGIQISSNVSRQGQTISFDTATKGKNWSHRDWFRKVQETGSSYISEIYKSEATNSFCLTLTVPIIRHGSLVGVLGADINFEDLLSI